MTNPATHLRVLAPNLKKRLSGVTATIARLVPLQAKSIAIAATGPGLPENVPHVPLFKVITMPRAHPQTIWRVWHARRNTEMLLGFFLKIILRKKLKLLFTSASQRRHTTYSRWLIGQMDYVIATSQKGQAYLKVPCEVVLHGIDTTQFHPIDNKNTLRRQLDLPQGILVGCFGRIRHQKGTDVFVDAMLDVCQQDDAIYGIILGNIVAKYKDFYQAQKQKITDAGLTKRILFLPEVPVDQIIAYYQALDIFIAPQRWEGFGLTPLEAMACGIPTIATTVGAFEELVLHEKTGLLVPPGDVLALKTATSRLLKDEVLRSQWSKKARTHTHNSFAIQEEADRLNQIYKQLLITDFKNYSQYQGN